MIKSCLSSVGCSLFFDNVQNGVAVMTPDGSSEMSSCLDSMIFIISNVIKLNGKLTGLSDGLTC